MADNKYMADDIFSETMLLAKALNYPEVRDESGRAHV